MTAPKIHPLHAHWLGWSWLKVSNWHVLLHNMFLFPAGLEPSVQYRYNNTDVCTATAETKGSNTCTGSTTFVTTTQLSYLVILHGSGALPYQGHLQATAVNNRQRAWSQNTGGLSTILHTTHKEQHDKQQRKQQLNNNTLTTGRSSDSKTLEELQQNSAKQQWRHHQQHHQMIRQKRWQQHTGSNSGPQHTMATIPHLKSGNTNSQPTWVSWTHSTPTCCDVQQQLHNDSQKQTWEEQHKH